MVKFNLCFLAFALAADILGEGNARPAPAKKIPVTATPPTPAPAKPPTPAPAKPPTPAPANPPTPAPANPPTPAPANPPTPSPVTFTTEAPVSPAEDDTVIILEFFYDAEYLETLDEATQAELLLPLAIGPGVRRRRRQMMEAEREEGNGNLRKRNLAPLTGFPEGVAGIRYTPCKGSWLKGDDVLTIGWFDPTEDAPTFAANPPVNAADPVAPIVTKAKLKALYDKMPDAWFDAPVCKLENPFTKVGKLKGQTGFFEALAKGEKPREPQASLTIVGLRDFDIFSCFTAGHPLGVMIYSNNVKMTPKDLVALCNADEDSKSRDYGVFEPILFAEAYINRAYTFTDNLAISTYYRRTKGHINKQRNLMFENILLHEVGHGVGLDHISESATDSATLFANAAIMYEKYFNGRVDVVLREKIAMCAIYDKFYKSKSYKDQCKKTKNVFSRNQ